MSSNSGRHVAVDLGASGGTVYAGRLTPDEVSISEVTRFDNGPIERGGRYIWDIDALRSEIVAALSKSDAEHGAIDTIGIDTWGIDFGFIADGELLRSPYSYRDDSLTNTRQSLIDDLGKREIFQQTGVSHWDATTSLFHFHYISQTEPEVIDTADRMVMMPQLLSMLLGGESSCEATVASTTQMVDPRTRSWATDLIMDAGLPIDVLPPVDAAGRVIGNLAPEYARKVTGTPELILPASHDTAAAVTGLPLADDERIFLNTGSWFIAGIELEEPVISDQAYDAGASNELGIDETVRFLRSLNGFFILEECRAAWKTAGNRVSYDTLIERMDESEPFGPLIVPNAAPFHTPENMPEKIERFCRSTDQSPPESLGEMTRCIIESLAVSTATVLEKLIGITEDDSDRIHLGGGGVRNEVFCQMLANAAEMPVLAGPVEASAIGNLLSQAFANGDVPSVDAGRDAIRSAYDVATYRPVEDPQWSSAKERMQSLIRETEFEG